MVPFSFGLICTGVFQLKRSFFSPYCAYGLMERVSCVYAIDAAEFPALRFRIDVVRVGGIFPRPEAVAAVHVLPTRVGDAARVGRIADPGAVVLQAAVDVIGLGVVDADVIELRDRQVHHVLPAMCRHRDCARGRHRRRRRRFGMRGIDPDVVEIAVRAARYRAEAAPAIGR